MFIQTPHTMKHLLLTLMLFSCAFAGLSAQDTDATECPYFNVLSTDTTGVDFSLLSTSVDATVSGVIANVVVEQTYFNGGDSTVDATYVFPMSTRAAIYAMEMEVDGRLVKAEIRRKAEAEEIFNNADTSGLTATLLEQVRPNVFVMSLANIGPDDSLKVRMVYTELLVPREGVYQFVFPSVVGPRYTTGGEPWVAQTVRDSLGVAETALNIDLKINGGMPVSATVLSHEAEVVESGNTAETTIATNPGDDFVVNFTLDKEEIETGMLLYEGEEENFFLSMIQPARPDISFVTPDREYIFIMDVSGSMRGEPLDLAKELIVELLSDLNSNDRFNIIFFAGGSSVMAPNSLPVNMESIDMAVTMIETLNGGGGTRLLPALEQALDMEVPEDYSRIFTILTDGYVTVEKEAFDLIRNNLDEANFFAFGIGNTVNRFIIEGMAYVGEGEPFIVSQGVSPEDVADDFREYIERPALNNIRFDFDGVEVYDVEPLRVPDVFATRPIVIYGKYLGTPTGSLTMTGDLGDGTLSETQEFADYTEGMEDNVALKYLWARKRIRLMADYGIASNETDTISIEEEITLLGLQYSLITEYTSFVAVDSNAVTSPADNADNNDDGDITDLFSVTAAGNDQIDYLQLRGTIVGADRRLQLRFAERLPSTVNTFSLRVTAADGKVLQEVELPRAEEDGPIFLDIQGAPAGLCFVSLVVNGSVWDTEKFVVR